MERIDRRIIHRGPIFTVRAERFRYEDGEEAEREVVEHPGAVAMVAHDDDSFFMVRQPREAVGEERLLELPAGKLDVEGEEPLEAARRELAEEIGKQASHWREMKRFYTSPGFASEEVHMFEATDLSDSPSGPDQDERIEIVEMPLADLDQAIEQCWDAKSLVGLLLLRDSLP